MVALGAAAGLSGQAGFRDHQEHDDQDHHPHEDPPRWTVLTVAATRAEVRMPAGGRATSRRVTSGRRNSGRRTSRRSTNRRAAAGWTAAWSRAGRQADEPVDRVALDRERDVSVIRYRMIPATSHGCFSALIPDAMMRRTPVTPWMTANG